MIKYRIKQISYSLPIIILFILLNAVTFTSCEKSDINPTDSSINPSTYMWYTEPSEKWEHALPVGNGRLGAMVYGRYGEEIIQLNEETYWSGGPYSTVVKGGYKKLPQILVHIQQRFSPYPFHG